MTAGPTALSSHDEDVVPLARQELRIVAPETDDDRRATSPPPPAPSDRRFLGVKSARGIAAWMLVPPVDLLALLLPLFWMPQHAKALVLMALVAMLTLNGAGRYRARLHISVLDDLPPIAGRLLAAAAIVGTLFAITNSDEELASFLGTLLVTIGLVVLGRIVTYQLILAARRRRVVAHPTVIVGGGPAGAEMATLLERYPQYGLRPVGFVDDALVCPAGMVVPRLGRVDDLDRTVAETGADVILVSDGEIAESALLDVVRRPACLDADLLVVPRLPQFHTQVGHADHIGSVPIMRIRTPSLSGPSWAVKRAVDVVVSAVALLLLAPIMAVIALAVRWEGGPGVLFRQDRVGRHGEIFPCLKFRSMRPATEAESATQWSIAQDDRVGRVGRFLRRSSLDEIPQFWSILRGDMTLIGPRPERPHFVDKFSVEVDRYHHRHRVRAGLTGLAQVSGLRGDTPINDRARFDNYYIENWSLWLDVKVLLRTFSEVFFARGR